MVNLDCLLYRNDSNLKEKATDQPVLIKRKKTIADLLFSTKGGQ